VHSASSMQSFSVALYGNTPVRLTGVGDCECPRTTAAWACSRASVRASGVLAMGMVVVEEECSGWRRGGAED